MNVYKSKVKLIIYNKEEKASLSMDGIYEVFPW